MYVKFDQGLRMPYVKAIVAALSAALVLGAATGAAEVVNAALARLPPEDKATICAASIGEGMNCAALFSLVFVPLALVLVFVVRWWRKRSASGGAG